MKYNNNKDIGDIYRDAFNDYRVEPSDKAWSNIEAKVSKPTAIKPNWLKNNYFIAVTSLVIVAALVFVIFRNNEPKDDIRSLEPVENISPIAGPEIEEEAGAVAAAAGKEQEPEKTDQKLKVEKSIVKAEQKKVETNLKSGKTESQQEKEPNIQEANDKTEHLPVESKDNTDNVNSNIQKDIVVVAEKNIQDKSKDSDPEEDENVQAETGGNEDNFKDQPTDPIELPADQKICKGDNVQLEVKGGIAFEWNNGADDRMITVNPPVTTIYAVTVTDAGQNLHYANVMVEVYDCSPLFVPNAFTPDGDGLNDEFIAKAPNVTDFNLRIHSRSGNVIFETDNINIGWDGRINGKMAQPGVYFYTIKFVDTLNKVNNMKGHLTLLR